MTGLFDKLLTWLVMNLGCFLSALYWRVGNRITIIGPRPTAGPLIVITSHQLFSDSFLLACTLDSWRNVLTDPQSALWHCPAGKWLKNPIVSWLSHYAHCLPINRATGRGHGLIKEILNQNGWVSIFPTSGLQATTATKRRAPVLLGKLIYETKPSVVPIRITGLPAWDGRKISQVIGWRKKLQLFCQRTCPGFGLNITIAIGEPLNFSGFYELTDPKEAWHRIAEELINNVSPTPPLDCT